MKTGTTEQPALLGGTPVVPGPYGQGCKHDRQGIKALEQRIDGAGALPLAMGPSIRQLRARGRELFGVAHAVPCSSGTAAIHTALAALGIGPGDEVITSPVTDAGTVLGIMSLNAIPVFADVQPDTLMIDAETIRPRITDRTRALLPVHYHGCPADMDGIMKLAGKRNLPVMEDCAQSWLARWQGRYVGTIGDAGAFSMNESKHVSVGEGGLMLSNRPEVAEYADRFVDKSYRRGEAGAPGPDIVALNYRLSELCAVLALRQLEKVETVCRVRHELGERLADGVASIDGLRLLRSPPGGRCTYWHGLLFVDPDRLGARTEWLAEALAAEGVLCSLSEPRIMPAAELFRKLHADPACLPAYRPAGLRKGAFPLSDCPHALAIRGRVITMRINEFMTPEDIDRVIEAARKLARWCRTAPRSAGPTPT